MKLRVLVSIALFLLSLSVEGDGKCPPLLSSQGIVVSPQCDDAVSTNCTVFTDAMEQLNSSSILLLSNGTHNLTRYTPISNLQDITIQGAGKDAVTVTCGDRLGLSFVNVSGLTLCGFTLLGCGLSGPYANISSQLGGDIELLFMMPLTVHYALILANIWDTSLQDLHVTRTRGMGLLAVNLMGTSTLEQVHFTSNIRQSCIPGPTRYPFELVENVYEQIGGGAYFLYQDYQAESVVGQDANISTNQLLIADSYFADNAECSYTAITQVSFRHFNITRFLVGGGGGLSLFLTQTTFKVETLVRDSEFYRNDARVGGGAHVGIFAGTRGAHVTFQRCLFEQNGVAVEGDSSKLVAGAGLAVFIDVVPPHHRVDNGIPLPSMDTDVLVEVNDTDFHSNIARVEGGGVLLYSLFFSLRRTLSPYDPGFFTREIVFQNSTFERNLAPYGAALYALHDAAEGLGGNFLLILHDVTFSESDSEASSGSSTLERSNFAAMNNTIRSAVALHKVFLEVQGTVECKDNQLTGLLLRSTFVLIKPWAELLVDRNTGHYGGGIHLTGEGAFISMLYRSVLRLRNNTGILVGGAVFVSQSTISADILRPIDPVVGCFISPLPINSDCFLPDCFDIAKSHIQIELVGNTAPQGSLIFGSTLAECSWIQNYISANDNAAIVYDFLFNRVQEVVFDVAPNSSSIISTSPATILAHGANNGRQELEVFPGQRIELYVEVRDLFGYIVPGTLTSYARDQNVTLGSSRLVFTDDTQRTCMMTVNAPEEEEFQVFIIELNSRVDANLSISTKNCSSGFFYDSGKMSCECEEILEMRGIECGSDKRTITSPDDIWVGGVSLAPGVQELGFGVCTRALEYCKDGRKEFIPPEIDDQCQKGLHRTGILCGGCVQNYSVSLSIKHSQCRRCSNIYLLLVIPAVAFVIAMFLIIAFLEVTVEKGWVYSIILFYNLLFISPLGIYLSTALEYVLLSFAFVFSFEIGLDVCFYDGMTALSRGFIRLIPPLIPYVLTGIFMLVSSKITLSKHFSVPKTFMTLSVMSYPNILLTCIQSFSYSMVETIGGRTYVGWHIDPNVPYFSGLHIILFMIACALVIVYLIPIPFLFLFPPLAYRFRKLGPFLDIAWAPFKPKWRFWLGVRFLLLLVLHITSSVHNTSEANFAFTLILLVFIEAQLIVQPFKKRWVNAVDSVLLGTVAAARIGDIFFQRAGNNIVQVAYFSSVLVFGYCLIIGVLVYHFAVNFHLTRKFREWLAARRKKKEAMEPNFSLSASTETTSSSVAAEDVLDEIDPSNPITRSNPTHSSVRMQNRVQNPQLQRADFSQLRESLLDDHTSL